MTTQKPAARVARELLAPVVDRYETSGHAEYAMTLKTYRFLRLSMVIVMVALGASVLLVRGQSTAFQQSISAYYYTSTKSVFVGALVATGVALTVIKGRTTAEDWLLSIAGVFAPVIAFVPTTALDESTLSHEALAAANNNLGALLIAGWVSWIAVAIIAWAAPDDVPTRSPNTEFAKWASVAGMLALLTVATGMFWWWPGLPHYAHGWSAVAMFAALGAAALVNGLGHRVSSQTRSTYSPWYTAVGTVMLLVGMLYAVTALTNRQWSHEVLQVEAIEITLFVVFWGMQSFERWNWTVSPSQPTCDVRGVEPTT